MEGVSASRYSAAVMIRLLLLLTAGCLAHGKIFNNPILGGADYPDPGAILVDGVYYVVTTSNNESPDKYPIHTSTDLYNWTPAGFVFRSDSLPPWSNKDMPFWAPEIHRVGNEFRVYFTSRDVASNHLSIGVATAQNVLGPYRSLDRPIWLDPEGDVLDSTLVNDNGNLYLMWKGGRGFIFGRPLNPDGLSFSSDQITEIFRNELPWEDTIVEAPWYVRRNQYHYLFYSGHDYCSELYRVGIARSLNPLGPYEKRGDPILSSNQFFQGPGHQAVVKDTDGVNDVMFFHAFKANEVCGPFPRLTCIASVGWGADDWPFVYDWN